MIKYYQLGTLLFFLTTIMYFSANRNKSVLIDSNTILMDNTKSELKAVRSELNNVSERLTVYYLITLEQNKGLDKFQSSRNWKANNKKLNELQTKLN